MTWTRDETVQSVVVEEKDIGRQVHYELNEHFGIITLLGFLCEEQNSSVHYFKFVSLLRKKRVYTGMEESNRYFCGIGRLEFRRRIFSFLANWIGQTSHTKILADILLIDHVLPEGIWNPDGRTPAGNLEEKTRSCNFGHFRHMDCLGQRT